MVGSSKNKTVLDFYNRFEVERVKKSLFKTYERQLTVCRNLVKIFVLFNIMPKILRD